MTFLLVLLSAPSDAAPFTPAVDDFEDAGAASRWLASNGVWQVGTPSVVGPSAAHSGSKCLATVINGNYPNSASSRAVSVAFDVPALAENPRLRFWQWIVSSSPDFGRVQISIDDGLSWVDLSPDSTPASRNISVAGGGVWTRSGYDLAQYAGQSVKLGFFFQSDTSTNFAGWYIDDVTIATGAVVALGIDSFEDPVGATDRWVADNGLWEIGVPSIGLRTGSIGVNPKNGS